MSHHGPHHHQHGDEDADHLHDQEVPPINGGNMTEWCMDYMKRNASHFFNKSTETVNPAPEPWQVWTIGLIAVTIISLASVIGIVLLPIMSKKTYNRALTYFVALGVGTLSGSAVFHLIPEAFGLHEQKDYLTRAWMVIAGVYLFFAVDKVLNMVGAIRDRKRRVTTVRPVANGTKPSNGTIVPVTQQDINEGKHEHHHIASVAWLVIFGDGLHNFIDGLSIGAAMNQSLLSGISIAVAVLCEELPHELGDCAILINSGMSLKKALFYNLASASTCYVGFVLGVILGDMDERFATMIFALAAGMFLYIALASMLSEMNKKTEAQMEKNMRSGMLTMALQWAGLGTGLVLMFLFAKYDDLIQF